MLLTASAGSFSAGRVVVGGEGIEGIEGVGGIIVSRMGGVKGRGRGVIELGGIRGVIGVVEIVPQSLLVWHKS